MTSMESKKMRKDKRDGNIAYQTIDGSKSSLDNNGLTTNTTERMGHNFNDMRFNTPINLKKSKTFKLIIKKGKDKDKISISKKEKSKNKGRKHKESLQDKEDLNAEIQSKRPLFGVSLSTSCKNSKSHDGYPLPAFFRSCVNYLERDNRLSFEGIYRIPGVNSQVSKLKQTLTHDCDISALLNNFDVTVIASIVKYFIRDLPEPIVDKTTEKLMFLALEENKDSVQDRILAMKQIIMEKLPIENQYFLSFLIGHMCKVIDMSHLNKMTLENLLIVLVPAVKLHFELLKFMYDHVTQLFGDLQVPVYVPPIRPGPQHEEELPETLEAINEELEKQISYLDDLHSQITEGIQNEKTEYLIWEVQLIVTKLKRKKYIMELNDPEQIKIEIKKYVRQLEKLRKELVDQSQRTSNDASNPFPDVVTQGGAVMSESDSVRNAEESCSAGAAMPSAIVDQEFWQVQRTLTTLNRKLKSLTQPTRPSHFNSAQHHHENGANVEEGVIGVAHHGCHEMGDGTGDTADGVYEDDDDDDSVQLNLTLRKLPLETAESIESVGSDDNKDKTEGNINQNDVQQSEPDISEKVIVENKSDVDENEDEKSREVLTSQTDELDSDDQHLKVNNTANNDVDHSVSSNGAQRTTTEDDVISNSESFRTGSNMAACIDDLIQTGELWTNDSEQLLPDDEDLRNEALRLLYTKEELISIHNDLKTRLSSESNEILRLKRNIEEIEEAKSRKTFLQQNQYHKLGDSPLNNKDISQGITETSQSAVYDDSEDSDDYDDCNIVGVNVGYGGGATGVGEESSDSKDYLRPDEEEMLELKKREMEILTDNARLELENEELLDEIQQERDRCLELKVALHSQMLLAATVSSIDATASGPVISGTESNSDGGLLIGRGDNDMVIVSPGAYWPVNCLED